MSDPSPLPLPKTLCGGISGDTKPVDGALTDLVDSIRADLWGQILEQFQAEAQESGAAGARVKFEEIEEPHVILEPLSYKSQIVAGVNYFIKIRVSHKAEAFDPKIFHVRVYRGFDKSTQVVRLTPWKELDDPIEYF